MPTTTEECSVCCENFNKSTHKPTACINTECEFIACRKCTQTYILGEQGEPQCMSCHKIWDTKWLKQEMTSTFINTALKKHSSTQLWEQELSKMP